MIPNSVTVRGAREAWELLQGIVDRARDSGPAWDAVGDDVFAFQRRWWLLEYGSRTDQEKRPGRDPQYMQETGGLMASATRRGAARQKVTVRPDYLLIEVTHGLAVIHEERDRPVLGDPPRRDVSDWVERVGEYILTGAL